MEPLEISCVEVSMGGKISIPSEEISTEMAREKEAHSRLRARTESYSTVPPKLGGMSGMEGVPQMPDGFSKGYTKASETSELAIRPR